MAKKTDEPTGSTATAKATPKPKKPDLLLPAKKVAQIIFDNSKPPDSMVVNRTGRVITFTYTEELPFVLNTLNKYTNELRKAFQVASLPKWKAVFMANGKQYVSTL
jgi:hypothetical protein